MASDKTEAEQNNFNFNRKDVEPVHNKARLQLHKKRTKTANLKNSLLFLKTLYFKLMKTTRY